MTAAEEDDADPPVHDVTNTAGAHSVVGIQAGIIRDSSVYISLPGDTPAQLYAIGVRHLRGGLPAKARELIDDAIARGHDGPEMRFHAVLAAFGKRSWGDLTGQEQQRVRTLSAPWPGGGSGPWGTGLATMAVMVESLHRCGTVDETALDALEAAPAQQRDLIVDHLDLILTGAAKERLWARIIATARERQQARKRAGRVWAYFYPDPIGPRRSDATRSAPQESGRFGVFAWSVGSVVGLIVLGREVLAGPTPVAAVALPVMLAAAGLALHAGAEWHYRRLRRATKDRELLRRPASTPRSGFARDVDLAFNRYIERYLPDDRERAEFVRRTTGLQAGVRDGIVRDYRESRTEVRQVSWIIRHALRQLIERWRGGHLLDHHLHDVVGARLRWGLGLALVGVVFSARVLVGAAGATAPWLAALATLAVVLGGGRAAVLALRLASERRCAVDADRERAAELADRQAAFTRWQQRLDRTRPTEAEMERWLDCDRKVLLDDTLQLYRLAWPDVIAHALLVLPARGCRRAKERGGPWRYSQYDVRLFLLTRHGVRERTVRLTFRNAFLRERERHSFRFDALSSVRVDMSRRTGYVLELSLTNGPVRSIPVTTADPDLVVDADPPSDDRMDVTDIDLDAAGFEHTRRVLEAIAADGKGWIPQGGRLNAVGDATGPTADLGRS